jgi:hypothetical protein
MASPAHRGIRRAFNWRFWKVALQLGDVLRERAHVGKFNFFNERGNVGTATHRPRAALKPREEMSF